MSDANVVEVVDRAGWRKAFPLQKAIIYIGSDGRNDVVLESTRGAGVSPRHLQLIAVPDAGYRLINMGDADIHLGAQTEIAVAPRAFVEIGNGDQVQVGDFKLTFRGDDQGGAGSPRESSANGIGLSLSLSDTQLSLERPLDGVVTVRNLGEKTGVQFKLEADGLDPACVEIGPGPLLFPNAEKEVPFRLHHPRAAKPPAGEYRFRIRATAPNAYPGQSASASQVIYILPYHSHKVRITSA
jgi:hypothetical protein